MLDSIILECFSKRGNENYYQSYLRIKYQVFVEEQGWSTLANESGKPVAREDPFDERGRFWLARTDGREAIGVVSGIPLQEGFPHRDLLEHHLRHTEVSRMFPYLCTLNDLAVSAPYRRRKYLFIGHKWEGTVAELLMLAIIRSMEQEGMRAVITTAGVLASARLCSRLGFLVIDRPTQTPLHSGLLMTNIGMVFGSPSHVRAQEECRMEPYLTGALTDDASNLLYYFEKRQDEVLGSQTLESFYEMAKPS